MKLIDVLSGSFCKAVRASLLVQTKLQMAEYSNVKFNRFSSQDWTEILTGDIAFCLYNFDLNQILRANVDFC